VKPTVAIVASVAIICVTIIELYALNQGHNGALLLAAVSSIFAFAGTAIGIKIAGK
jgi:hypothetical protein